MYQSYLRLIGIRTHTSTLLRSAGILAEDCPALHIQVCFFLLIRLIGRAALELRESLLLGTFVVRYYTIDVISQQASLSSCLADACCPSEFSGPQLNLLPLVEDCSVSHLVIVKVSMLSKYLLVSKCASAMLPS